MEIYNQDESEEIYADLMFDNCDTPAARKISGTAGHSADFNPCPWCDFILIDLNKPAMFPPICKSFIKFIAETYIHVANSMQ